MGIEDGGQTVDPPTLNEIRKAVRQLKNGKVAMKDGIPAEFLKVESEGLYYALHQMFTVAQFFEKQQLRVLAVPSSWIRDGFLMWPKIPSNEKLDKLRTSGIEFHGAMKKIPVLAGKKYKSLEAAEAAADSLLKQDVSDIETKRRILKLGCFNIVRFVSISETSCLRRLSAAASAAKISDLRPLKDYNKIIQDLTSAVPINVLENQLIEPTLITDDNIIYINTPTNCSETIRESDFSVAITMVPLKSEVTLRETLTILKTEVTAMRNEMTQLKSDITVSIRLAVEDCLEKSFQRFATILDMERKVASHVLCEVNIAEEHKLIDDEDDLINFNKKLASKQVREEYIKYFSKIIVPVAYYSEGDSACYLIVDRLFTRAFWNAFTWTGISRGTKSKRGFRELANVLQLLLAIVSVGDPTYTSIKLETFCKNRLFRYSKSRCSSKQLRKSTCRLTKKKKDEACSNSVEIDGHDDDDDFSDELIYNTASDPNQTELQPEVEVLISVDDC
ncbi:uncharacterized protein LOC131428654 [Malaya genurostris]|uniref:uncharacterized protein LOC131428654 n=1 Tax=Malaya genurostris TaxID=325434 RepID=UPI0026F3AA35|nr:uncharacterized protein LOC131428654 [Malaya genurostris]